MVPFSFAGQEWCFAPGNALYWPREQALLVADLHLEKASHYAQGGQFLPPYDSRETLTRLSAALTATGARRVFCLGDNFHDAGGPARLEPQAARLLAGLTAAVDWVWITGNHDGPGTTGRPDLGGTTVDELAIGGLHLRHEARPDAADSQPSGAELSSPELSGHFHPKLRVRVRGRMIARPCAVRSDSRLVLPAFGALTGGMDAADPAIITALQPATAIDAVLAAGPRLIEYPLWRAMR